ncbi:MAG TPA: hypothetical protein VJN93_18170 [Candidatus Acidoferrum sp.]|nr:hypothetical protein [Candidatus Acidoferrum sp.]
MKNLWRAVLIGMAGLTLAGALLILPSTNARTYAATTQAAPQTQSISGKIAAVGSNSFTLTIATSTKESVGQDPAPHTMSFTVDKNTTIEGTLRVGSNADVTYRQENGANLAVSVHVTP